MIALLAAVFASNLPNLGGPSPGEIQTPYEEVIETSLAQNLSTQFEFAINFSGSELIDEFTPRNLSGQYDWIFGYEGDGKTTNHSPGIPFAKAVASRFGFRFSGAYLGKWLFVIAFLFLTLQIFETYGGVATFAFIATVTVDQWIQTAGHEFMLMSSMTLAFAFAFRAINAPEGSSRPIWNWPLAGIFFGISTMFRDTITLVFVLAVALGLCWCVVDLIRKRSSKKLFEHVALFVIGFIIVALPWWARNCRLAEKFVPLGGAVNTKMITGYSDEAIENDGNIRFDELLKKREQFMITAMGETLVENELAFAGEMGQEAEDWRTDNQNRLFSLAASKATNHLGLAGLLNSTSNQILNSGFNLGLLIIGLIGCIVCWRQFGGLTVILVFSSVVVTALTWSNHGSYFLPYRPMLHFAIAAGLGTILRTTSKSTGRNEPA